MPSKHPFMYLFLIVPCIGGLQSVIVAAPGHTHLLLKSILVSFRILMSPYIWVNAMNNCNPLRVPLALYHDCSNLIPIKRLSIRYLICAKAVWLLKILICGTLDREFRCFSHVATIKKKRTAARLPHAGHKSIRDVNVMLK